MVKAFRVGEKASSAGFDWGRKEDIWDKVKEETAEVEAEMRRGDSDRMADEMGDLLFSMVNMCRLYGIDPELALERANKKFISRFNHMESEAERNGGLFTDLNPEQMEELWQHAKQAESQATEKE